VASTAAAVGRPLQAGYGGTSAFGKILFGAEHFVIRHEIGHAIGADIEVRSLHQNGIGIALRSSTDVTITEFMGEQIATEGGYSPALVPFIGWGVHLGVSLSYALVFAVIMAAVPIGSAGGLIVIGLIGLVIDLGFRLVMRRACAWAN